MFEKFGELNSFLEINELAENLFNEGDIDGLKIMAKENGIQKEFVEMYLKGDTSELCDAITAAIGKIELEEKQVKPKEIMEDWTEYIKAQCMENETLALRVREKGKTLKGCIADLISWSFKHQQDIGQDIVREAGISAGRVTLGIPGMGQAKRIIRDYYMGGREK